MNHPEINEIILLLKLYKAVQNKVVVRKQFFQ